MGARPFRGLVTRPLGIAASHAACVSLAYSPGRRALYATHVADSSVIGIDLSDDGVTANDVDDPDTGANERQNFPVLDSALVAASGLSVTGSLDVPVSVAGGSYRIALYENAACDASGHGEGEVYLGTKLVSLSNASAGSEKFTFTLPVNPPALGQMITATDESRWQHLRVLRMRARAEQQRVW
jgi:hypothetical protein